MHLDGKDDDAARTGDEVGQHQVVVLNEKTLYYEGSAANGHRDKAWQRNTVCITCTDSLDGLRQIAEYQTKGGYPATNVNQQLMFHSIFVLVKQFQIVGNSFLKMQRYIQLLNYASFSLVFLVFCSRL